MDRSSTISMRTRKDQALASEGGSVVQLDPDSNGGISEQTANASVTDTLRFPAHYKFPGTRRNGDSKSEEKRVNLSSKEEGSTKEGKKSGGKMVQGMFGALLLTAGVAIASYTQVIPEPAKLLLLGTVLVGGALWARRQLKEH